MKQTSWRVTAAASGGSRLSRPRFGVPVVVNVDAPFEIETVESPGAAAPAVALAGDDGLAEVPLHLDDVRVIPGARGVSRVVRRARAVGVTPGAYGLVARWPDAHVERVPRAVWLRDDDPGSLPHLRVAHVTDLHVGAGARPRARLERVIAEVNRLAPHLVLVTGDVANNGDRASLMPEARQILCALEAPVLVVPGNHDHGFHPRALAGLGPGPGWHHFADTFHPHRLFSTTLGGWRFVGFDSGASRVSPLIRTHGIGAVLLESLAAELDGSHANGQRGVVLFSHTPTRTRLTGTRPSSVAGPVGRMGRGRRALEDLLRAAARRGQRVLHLTGHTHWTEVFEIDDRGRFMRWDHRRFEEGPQSIAAPVALVNSQSASHAGVPIKPSARGHGFTHLWLDADAPRIEFHRYE